MQNTLRTLIVCLTVILTDAGYAKGRRGGDVHVKGYTRRDGTYVQPHYRSAPNSTASDNWSTSGNINPYTGEVGTKNTDRSSGSRNAPSIWYYEGNSTPSEGYTYERSTTNTYPASKSDGRRTGFLFTRASAGSGSISMPTEPNDMGVTEPLDDVPSWQFELGLGNSHVALLAFANSMSVIVEEPETESEQAFNLRGGRLDLNFEIANWAEWCKSNFYLGIGYGRFRASTIATKGIEREVHFAGDAGVAVVGVEFLLWETLGVTASGSLFQAELSSVETKHLSSNETLALSAFVDSGQTVTGYSGGLGLVLRL